MKQEETTVGVQDTLRRVSFAIVFGKPVEATFDGGILSSDSGVMLLREKPCASIAVGTIRSLPGLHLFAIDSPAFATYTLIANVSKTVTVHARRTNCTEKLALRSFLMSLYRQ